MAKEKIKKKRQASKHRGSMKLITVLLVIVCGCIIYRTWQINNQIASYEEQAVVLEEEIKEALDEQEAIEEQIEYMKTDEYIEDLAREKLGLIYDNEIIFKRQSR